MPHPQESKSQVYLPLALSLKIYYTHVHNGAKIGEGFHGHNIWSLFITVHIELEMKIRSVSVSQKQEPNKSGDFMNL